MKGSARFLVLCAGLGAAAPSPAAEFAAPGPFVELGLMGTKDFDERIVLDVAEMRAATPRVLERYRISADRSLRPAAPKD